MIVIPLVGKQVYEVSFKEALDLLKKECSPEEYQDVGWTYYYRPGKGYEPCNDLLNRYLKGFKDSDSPGISASRHKRLMKYCGYTDDFQARQMMVAGNMLA